MKDISKVRLLIFSVMIAIINNGCINCVSIEVFNDSPFVIDLYFDGRPKIMQEKEKLGSVKPNMTMIYNCMATDVAIFREPDLKFALIVQYQDSIMVKRRFTAEEVWKGQGKKILVFKNNEIQWIDKSNPK